MKQATPKQKVLTPPLPARQNPPVKKNQKTFFSPAPEGPILLMGPTDNSLEREANILAERAIRRPGSDDTRFAVFQKANNSTANTENKPISPVIHSRVTAVVNSPGQPLEEGMRFQMESFFRESFSRIRVHDDRQAHESAALLQARAYTYDNHIVFSANAYQPHSLQGKKLITHEITHTLQQSDGEKLIQRDPDKSIVETKKITVDFQFSPQLENILNIHKKANPSISAFVDKLLRIQQNNGWQVLEQYAEKIAGEKTISTSEDAEMDLLFDIYKALGKNPEAAKLAKEKKYLPQKTAFYSADFYKEVLQGDLKWLPENPYLKKYIPAAFVDTFRMYLYGPLIKVQSLDLDALTKKQSEIIGVIKSGSGLVANERDYIAIEAFVSLDSIRKQYLSEVDSKIKKDDAFFEKMIAAREFIKFDLNSIFAVKYAEISQLVQTLNPEIHKIASDAYKFWKGISDATKQIQQIEIAAESVAKLFSKHKDLFKDFERLIAKAALTYLRLTSEGDIPPSGEFEQQRKEAADLIAVLIKNASLDLIRATRKDVKEIPPLFGYLIYYLDDLRIYLLPTAKNDANESDNKIIKRLNFAKTIGNLGFLMSSHQLSEISIEVKNPTGKQIFGGIQKKSFLAFRGKPKWEQKDLSASQTLREYLKENTTIAYSPAFGSLMEYFFVNASMEEEIKKLKNTKELQNDSKEIEIDLRQATLDDYVPIPNRIRKSMDEMSKEKESIIPRRFVTHSIYFSAAPDDQAAFSKFLFKNDRFNKNLDENFGEQAMIIAPMNVETHMNERGVVVWVLSENRLKQFATSMLKLFPDIVIPIDSDKQPLDWWNAFLVMVKDAEAGKVNSGLPGLKDMKTKTAKSLKDTTDMLNFWRRKAISYHRRVVVRLVIRPLWQDYKDVGISTWENPSKAIDQMIYLAGSHPYILDEHGNEELKMQIAAAMLEIAPLVYDKLLDQGMFGGAATSRLTIVAKLLPHVAGAVSLEKEVANERKSLLIEYPAGEHEERVKKLRNLQKGLTEVLRSIYKSQVEDFISLEGGNIKIDKKDVGDWLQGNKKANELRDLNSTEAFNPKTPITSEGNTYTLLQVYKDFNYQPAVEVDAGGVKWDKDLVGDINPSVLIMRDDQGMHPVTRKDRKGEILFTYQIVDKNANASEPIPVRDTDDVVLKEIYSLIYVYSGNVNLVKFAEVLEAGAEWLKLPFYFIPGLGEVVMAADLVVGILQFLASEEFRTLKKLLMDGDGKELIKEAFDLASSFFSTEKLFDKLLDENFEIPKFDTPQPKTKQDDSVNQHSDGKLMKFVNAIVNFGKKLWNGVSWLKSAINYVLKQIHTFILNRPILAAVISMITNNYYFLETAIQAGKSILSLGDDGKEGEKVEDVSPLSQLISSLPAQLGELQVPLNLVPLDSLLDLIVRMALKVLKGPKGVIAGSVKKILEEAGIYQKVLNLVSNKLSGTGLDPNKYINDFINSKIQPVVQSAGNFFVEQLSAVFGKVPDLKGVPAFEKPTIGQFKDSGESVEDEPETQPFPGSSFNLSAPSLLPAHPTNGVPLRWDHQKELEEKYDQDFSHVRFHNDAEADHATREAGAEALATGSHIYLRDGLSPDTGPGDQIFRHELAHVVQQTGPRPVSITHSNKPVDGKPGKGIVYDPAKEAEANAFAKGGTTASKLSVTHASDSHQGAIHPLWGSMPLKFFKVVSKEPEGPTVSEKILLSSMGARLTDEEKVLETNIPNDLSKAFAPDNIKPHKRMGDDAKLFSDYLKGQQGFSVLDFGRLIRLSKVKKSGGKDKDESWQVDGKRLGVGLKELIAIHTGVMTDFKLKVEGSHIVVTSISVNNLFLDKMNRGTNIWKRVIVNTFASPGKSAKLVTKFTDNEANISAYSEAAKKMLQEYDFTFVFASAGLKFTDNVAKKIEDWMNPSVEGLHTGTKDDPIPINWYKNTTIDYPQTIKLPRAGKGDYPMVPTGAPFVATYQKTEKLVQIGIDREWMVKSAMGAGKEKATKLMRGSTKRGGAMAADFREVLLSFGYDMQARGMDADHVTDLAFGGKDDFSNLWPLKSSINRIAYDDQWYKRYLVEYKTIKAGKEAREITSLFDTESHNKYFIIKGYSHEPERPGGRWTAK